MIFSEMTIRNVSATGIMDRAFGVISAISAVEKEVRRWRRGNARRMVRRMQVRNCLVGLGVRGVVRVVG